MNKKLFFIAVLIFCSVSSFAQTKEQTVKQLINLSGIEARVYQLPPMVFQFFTATGINMHPGERENLMGVLLGAFQEVKIMEQINTYYLENYNKAKADKVLKILTSPEAQIVAEKETKVEDWSLYKSFVSENQNNPKLKDRKEKIIKHIGLIGAEKSNYNLLKTIQESFVKVAPKINKNIKPDELALLQEEQLLTIIREDLAMAMLYVYQNVSDEELNKYFALFNDKNIEWYSKLQVNSMNSVLDKINKLVDQKAAAL